MTTGRGVEAAVADLQARWGAAAPRTLAPRTLAPRTMGARTLAPRTLGALALAPAPAPAETAPPAPATWPASPQDRGGSVIRTGFAALDAILGPGGLPRSASVAIRGDGTSGRTTLALRVAAEAQAAGAIVAWLDLGRSLDPVEAVSRGVRLEWFVVLTPTDLDEGLSIAGALLAGRAVDLLVLDLPGARATRIDPSARVIDRLSRLAAMARRAGSLLLILDTPGSPDGLAGAVVAATGIRLELARRSWIRLERDVVGQCTETRVAHNRYGPPDRRALLRILYAEGGDRDACLARDDLLTEAPTTDEAPTTTHHESIHANPPPLHPAPRPQPRADPSLRVLPGRSARAGWPAVDATTGHRRQPRRAGPGHPSRHAAGERAPARP